MEMVAESDTSNLEVAATPPSSVMTRANEIVPQLVLAGSTSVVDLAAALAMSRRSLERALAAEGVSPATLFDRERRRLAQQWLPTLTVEEVARRLGYANAPAFSRAFRRWTGSPPSTFQTRRGRAATPANDVNPPPVTQSDV